MTPGAPRVRLRSPASRPGCPQPWQRPGGTAGGGGSPARCRVGEARGSGVGSGTDALANPWPPVVVGSVQKGRSVTPILEARGLTKRFGRTQALAGLDLVAEPGRVAALLGPNGAGKTTFVRAVATLLRPDEGSLRVA